MLLNNSVCTLMYVSFPIDFQDGVNDFDVGFNESIIIFLLWMPNDANECPKVLLNVD